jgi:hypothetical protein
MAARVRVDELHARQRRVGRGLQRTVLGVRVEGRLQRGEAVDALGELGQRLEDARVRPARAVGDESARVVALDEGLGGAEGEVLDRDEAADSGSDGVEVVAQRSVAAREGLANMAVLKETHGRGDDGRRRRVAAEEELLAGARRGHCAHAARKERIDEARVYERPGGLLLGGGGERSGGSSDREGSGHLFFGEKMKGFEIELDVFSRLYEDLCKERRAGARRAALFLVDYK